MLNWLRWWMSGRNLQKEFLEEKSESWVPGALPTMTFSFQRQSSRVWVLFLLWNFMPILQKKIENHHTLLHKILYWLLNGINYMLLISPANSQWVLGVLARTLVLRSFHWPKSTSPKSGKDRCHAKGAQTHTPPPPPPVPCIENIKKTYWGKTYEKAAAEHRQPRSSV